MSETHSVASSQRTSSSTRSSVGSRFFYSDFPVFPMFLSLESGYHYYFTYAGLLVQFLQMLTFVCNPHLSHGETLLAFSRAVYTVQLPFWDTSYTASTTWGRYLPLFCITCVMVVGVVVALLAVAISRIPTARDHMKFVVLRLFLHSITSWLFIPILQGLLSQMVCSHGTLWAFPTKQCFDPSSTLGPFVVGIVTFVLVCLLTYIVETTLYLDDYHSEHPLARKHYICDVFYTTWRIMTCALFQVFLSGASIPVGSYSYTWVPMYVFFSSVLMAASYVFFLPFIHQTTTRLFTIAFMELAMISIVVFFSAQGAIHPSMIATPATSNMANMDVDGLVCVSAFVLVFIAGWWLADYRLNREMTESLPQLLDAAAPYPEYYSCLYPKGLPLYDVAYRTTNDTSNDVADGAFVEKRSLISLETPFLTHVYVYTDVEVSTRFLSVVEQLTGRYPTPEMLLLAARIYGKGILRFQESVSVILSFAAMINSFTAKSTLALLHCDRTNTMACTFPTRYHSFRMLSQLKLELLRDTTYQRTCDEAKRAHKEILVSLYQFWSKLISQQDANQLLTTYSSIARKREDTNRMFVKALEYQTNDRYLLLKYADFLEQVMLQPERAEKLRAFAKQAMEQQRLQGVRQTKQKQRTTDFRQLLEDTVEVEKANTHVCGIRMDVNNMLKALVLFLIFGTAVGMLVTSVIMYIRRRSTLRCVEYSSTSRNLRMLGDLLAMQYWNGNGSSTPAVSSSASRLHSIQAVADDMLSIHNYLSYGLDSKLSGNIKDFWLNSKVVEATYVALNTAKFRETSFLGLGYSYVQFLSDIPGVLGRNSTGGGQVSEDEIYTDLSWLFDSTTRAWATSAYNTSVLMCKDWYTSQNNLCMYIMSGLFGFSLVCIVLYAELASMSNPVEKLKKKIISLFMLIPRRQLQEMANNAKSRVEQFDRSDAMEDDGVRMQEVELAPANSAAAGNRAKAHDAAELDESGVSKAGAAGDKGDATGSGKANLLDSGEDSNEDDGALHWEDNGDRGAPQPLLSPEEKQAVVDEGASFWERNRTTAPVAMGGYTYIFFFVCLVIAHLVVSIFLLTELNDSKSHQSNIINRVVLYNQGQEQFLVGAYGLTCMFQSGTTAAENTWGVKAQSASMSIPNAISLSPTLDEVVSLRDVGSAISLFLLTMQQPALDFWRFKSSLTTTFDMTTMETPVVEKGEMARFQTFQTTQNNFILLLNDTINTLTVASNIALEQSNDELTHLRTMEIVAIGIGVACIIGYALLLCYVMIRYGSAYVSGLNALFIFFAMGCLIGSVVLSSVTYVRLDHLRSHRLDQAALASEYLPAVMSFMWPLLLASNINQLHVTFDPYVSYLNPLFVLQYFDLISNNTQWEMIRQYMTNADATQYTTNVKTLIHLEMVSLALMCNSTGFMPLELENFTWDFDSESDAMYVRLHYPDDTLRYSTSEYDYSQNVTYQNVVARNIISNQRIIDLVSDTYTLFINAFAVEFRSLKSTVQNDENYVVMCAIIRIALSGTAAVMLIISVIIILYRHTKHMQELSDRGTSSAGLVEDFTSTFETSRVFIALGIVFVCVVAIFVLALVELLLNQHRAEEVYLMNMRSFFVTSSMIAGEMWAAEQISVPQMQGLLQSNWGSVDYIRTELSTTPTNVFSYDKGLSTFLQGSNVQLSEKYRYGFDPVAAETGTPIGPSVWTFMNGVENALATWMQESTDLSIAASTGGKAIGELNAMRGTIMRLLRGLDEGSHIFLSFVEKRVQAFFIAEAILCILLLIVIVGMLVIVSIPVARRQAVEEMAYRMLVRLIPGDVRESIPAIRDYMAFGLDGEKSLQGDDDLEEVTLATIAINRKGTVIKFNRHAEELFGYAAAEVLGNNVSLLMSKRIGARHTSFIERYMHNRKPTHRRIFRNRELYGQKKNGEMFMMHLTVYEMRRSSGDFAFIGFIEDVSARVERKREEGMSRFILEHVTVPMIAIDTLGTVLRFNHAAEECFGRSANDVINQNVKMLMPEDVAAKHDTYLATYLRTKQKHIIDTVARVHGVRKKGEEFPMELKVKEIICDNVSTYLGFCRDLTDDAELEEAIALNNAMMEASVIPVICTDLYGRVVLYSKSAERVFGYTAEEVLNNNCKMLMPASISDHHDDYLEQYRASWNKRASTIVDREVMGRHKNGQLIPLLAMLQEVKSSSSMYGGLLGFFRELSDQRALERSLNIEDVAAEFHAHPLIIMNSQGIIQRVNRAAVVEFGFSREELLQSNVSMLMPDAVAAHHDEYLARYMITGVTSVIGSARRVQAQRKDGTLVPVELRVREVRDSDGSNVLFVGFLRVLTRDLRMERQLLINRMTMESSLSPLAAIDADGAILQCNELLEKMLKYNRGDLIGMQINGLLAGEEEVIRRDGSKLATERVLNDVRTPLGIPVRRIMLATDGTRIPVDAKAQEVKAAKGGSERSSFLVLIHDTRQDGLIDLITSRNASVGQLSPVPLMEFDLSGRIVRFNKAAETKLQWTKDEVVGMNASSLFVNPELFSEKIAKASETAAQALTEYNILNADVAPTTFRTMVQTKKGETFPAQVSMCEIVADQDVKMNTFVMFIEDVTETMRLQQVSRSCHVYTELSPHALVVCTASGAIISCNSATCRIFHYRDVNELIGKDVGVLMPDSLAAHHRNFLSVYQKTGEARRIGRTTSVQCKRSDGVLFVCQLMVHEIKKSNAAETIYVGCLMDQTENAEMDHARRTLESMLKLSSDAIIFMDEAGVIQQANEVAMRLFGFSSMSSFVGKNIESMVMEIRSRDPDNTLGAYALHDSKSSRRRTVQCLRHDKSIFDAELTVQELHYRETRMYAACFSDCEATTTLHGRRKLNMAVAENCPVPVVVINSVGTVESFSPAAEAFFGYSAAEVIGGNVRKLMPPADAQRHDSYLRMYNPNCESSVVGKSSPQQARLSNGEIVPVNLHVKEIAGDDGHSSFVGFFIDRQTEAAFDKAIERGGAVARGSMEPLLVVSNSGTILHVNSALEQQFAYTRSELVGQRVSVLVPESILVGPKNNRSQWHVQRGTVVVSKDGRQREVDVLVTRALQDDGDAPAPRMNEATHAMDSMWQRPTTEAAGRRRLMPVYYVLLLDSASAFRFARTEQRYDSLMNYVKDFGIIEVELGHNRSLTVVRANQAAGNMLGRRVQELAGVSLQTLVGDSSVIRQLVHFAETKEKEGTATATSGMEDVGPKQRIMTTTTTLKGPTGAAECPCEITAERISTESIIIHMRESWKEHQNRMKGALVDALRGTIAEAYIIVNDEDDVVSINEAGSQLLGFTDGQHLAAHHIIDGGVVELYEGKGTTVSPTDARSSGYRTVHLDMATSSALGDVTDGVCHRKITDQFADTVRTIIQSNEVRRRVYVKRSDGSRLFAEVTLCPVQLSTSMMSSVPSRGTPGFSQELSRRTSVSSGQQASVTYYVVFIKDPSFMQQLVSATQIGTSILESSPGAIVVTDVQGLVVKFNAAAERLFLFERHHIIGKSVKMLMRDVDAARHDEFMMAYMQTKTRHVINSTRRVTAERRDGSAFVADLFLKEVVDDRGNPFMFVGYFKEVKNAATR